MCVKCCATKGLHLPLSVLVVDISVEEFRFENVEVTPAALALDSPIMVRTNPSVCCGQN